MKKISLRIGIVLILTLAFLYFFFRSVNTGEVLGYLTEIDLKFFILFILMVPLHFATRAARWHYLLKHEKEKVSFYNRFAANAVGFTVSFIFPGRIGEIIKPLYLAKKEEMRKGFVLGTVVIERIFDIFVMCALLGLFMISKPLYASIFRIDEASYAELKMWGFVGVALSGGVLLIALSFYFFKDKTLRILNFILRPIPKKASHKITELTDEFIHGLKFFHTLKDLIMYILWSFIVWLGIISLYWVFFFAYNIRITFFFLFPYVFLILVGASIPTPGMVGGFHYFSKVGLTSFYNLDANLAVGMTIVCHAVQVAVTCILGYVILSKEGISLFQIKKLGENKENSS